MGLKDERRLLDFEPSIFTREKLNTASGLVFCKSSQFFHKILSSIFLRNKESNCHIR